MRNKHHHASLGGRLENVQGFRLCQTNLGLDLEPATPCLFSSSVEGACMFPCVLKKPNEVIHIKTLANLCLIHCYCMVLFISKHRDYEQTAVLIEGSSNKLSLKSRWAGV